jgi:hypothetical protein
MRATRGADENKLERALDNPERKATSDVALSASSTHLFAPGIQLHLKAAIDLFTPESPYWLNPLRPGAVERLGISGQWR